MDALTIIACVIGGIIGIPLIIVLVFGFVTGDIGNKRYAKRKKEKNSSSPSRKQFERYHKTGDRNHLC